MPPPVNRRRRKPRPTGPHPDVVATWSPAEQAAHRRKLQLETPVAELPLAVRVINTLEEENVVTVEDLLDNTVEELLAVPNFGETTLREVAAALESLGIAHPWAVPKPARGRKKAAC